MNVLDDQVDEVLVLVLVELREELVYKEQVDREISIRAEESEEVGGGDQFVF